MQEWMIYSTVAVVAIVVIDLLCLRKPLKYIAKKHDMILFLPMLIHIAMQISFQVFVGDESSCKGEFLEGLCFWGLIIAVLIVWPLAIICALWNVLVITRREREDAKQK